MKVGWAEVALGEVASVARTSVPADAIRDGILYVGLENIEAGGALRDVRTVSNGELQSTKFSFEPTDVLYGKLRPYLCKIARPAFSGVCSTDIVPVRPSQNLDADYLAYFLRQPAMVALASERSAGANLPRLSPAELLRFRIPLPPLEEQRRLARVLDHAQVVRSLRATSLTRLDALAGSIFHEMFGAEEEMSHSFADVCDRVTVGVVIRPASHYVESGVPALRTSNVKPGALDLTDLVYFSRAANNGPLAKSKLRSGDLVIARTGKPGTTAVVPPHLDGANAIDLIVATPNLDYATPIYLEHLLNSQFGQRIVRGQSRGQIQQHFNVGSLKAAEIPLPALPRQRTFEARIQGVVRHRTIIERASAGIAETFTSLQDRAFAGRL